MNDEEIYSLKMDAARLHIISVDMATEAMIARRNWYQANKRLEAAYENRRIEAEVQKRLARELSIAK